MGNFVVVNHPRPGVRVAAETALAGGWLGEPTRPSTVITDKKGSFSTF